MFDEKMLTRLAGGLTVYSRAHEYARLGRVKLTSVVDVHDGIHIEAAVKGSGSNEYEVEVELTPEADDVSYAYCDCPAFGNYSDTCKHVVATLICYQQKGMMKNAEVRSDFAARNVLSAYREKDEREINIESAAEEPQVGFEPVLERLYGTETGAMMRAKVGYDKKCFIRNFHEFYYAMLSNKRMDYGKKLSWLHSMSGVTPLDKPIVSFIMDVCATEPGIQRDYYASRGGVKPDRLRLNGNQLDALIELMSKRTLCVDDAASRPSDMIIVDGDPHYTLSVREDKRGGIMIGLLIPVCFIGGAHLYISDSERGILFRTSTEYMQALLPIIRAFSGSERGTFFSDKDASAFFASVYPHIERYVTLPDDAKKFAQLIPLPIDYSLSLDMPARNLITGELRFDYGAFAVNPYKENEQHANRNVREETRLQRMTERHFNARQAEKLAFAGDDDEVYGFLTEDIPQLMKLGEVFVSDRLKNVETTVSPKVQASVSIQANLLDLSLDITGFPLDELESVLDAYRLKRKYFRLKNGQFLKLGDGDLSDIVELSECANITAEELMAGHATLPQYRAMYLDTLMRTSESMRFDRDAAFKTLVRGMKNVEDSGYQLTDPLKKTLRNYQKTGYRWLRTLSDAGFGGILADDMGLGKTLQIIALLSGVKAEAGSVSALIVCPASLVLNWKSEIEKFEPSLRAQALLGSFAQRKTQIEECSEYNVTITSYDQLKRDVQLYEGMSFDYEIIDEAQVIKNAHTQGAKASKAIKAAHRFALTGTPIENRLSELWSIFDFLMQGYLFQYARFKDKYEVPIMKKEDNAAVERLRRMTAPFILRRMKSEVLKELPPKTETVRMVPLEGEQEKLYAANLLTARTQVQREAQDNTLEKNKLQILALLTRLRQICCDPRLFLEDYDRESVKLDMCMELVGEAVGSGHKLLIFSQFTSMLELIKQRLAAEGFSCYVLQGSTSKEERLRLVSAFNEDDTNVFLISLKAGGLGLNLTGADVVIHYDPWWNTAAQNQATDRAYRIGQTKPVQVFKLITQNTIEQRIMALQERKQALADSIITEGNALAGMTEKDWLELFS